jgi:hypothetical protein
MTDAKGLELRQFDDLPRRYSRIGMTTKVSSSQPAPRQIELLSAS